MNGFVKNLVMDFECEYSRKFVFDKKFIFCFIENGDISRLLIRKNIVSTKRAYTDYKKKFSCQRSEIPNF
jgi:hypothetical protein